MTDLYHSTGPQDDAGTPLLPETLRLLERLGGMTSEELASLRIEKSRRVASYHARPEPNVPLLKFRIMEADRNLLTFVGQEAAGFEVLQVFCAGFQYHWRSDLSRAFEEQAPLVSRVYGLSDTQELAVDHLVVPVIRKHRVRVVRGWLAFSQDLDTCGEWASQSAGSLFRRTEPARPVRLPARLWDPERRRLHPAGLFRAVNRGWRESREPRRP
ncbi:hypothetical protein Rumeso_04277 [Rubellimicrobium mesophilum DSM 19309]|uniref:Uncharacterized protein n=1 Tax=Rubellimicrobium mesophilum DSM 19309 TaxID=442562 RepID=A0A017HIR6_9RHOB|nr:hypothetical protein [Rubellimicrobium mesophilum]EYD74220.1 hypothetical protein Rumeso_04277 [Rubellimicrobium mesophilum DSM 19309]